MRRRIIVLVLIALGLSSSKGDEGVPALSRRDGAWKNVAPVGSCSRCGRNVYESYLDDVNIRVPIFYPRNIKRFDGCLECLLAAVDSADAAAREGK